MSGSSHETWRACPHPPPPSPPWIPAIASRVAESRRTDRNRLELQMLFSLALAACGDKDAPETDTSPRAVDDTAIVSGPWGSLAPTDADGVIDWTEEPGGFGRDVAIGDLNNDSLEDVFAGARPSLSSGIVAFIPSPIVGRVSATSADAVFEADPYVAESLALGNIGADDDLDLLVGSPDGNGSVGIVHLLLQPSTAEPMVDAGNVVINGPEDSHSAGSDVAIGDISGDGVGDAIVGVPGYLGTDSAAVWLVLGPQPDGVNLTLGETGIQLRGTDRGDEAGTALAVDDFDGDGRQDLLIGARGLDGSERGDEGGAFVVLGPVDDSLSLADADRTLFGSNLNDAAGDAVAAGDLDGDGHPEIVIGAHRTSSGSVYVTTWESPAVELSDSEAVITGSAASDLLGGSVAVGDLDGDGRSDLCVGGLGAAESNGAVWIFAGPVVGARSATEADGTFEGDDDAEFIGGALALGDVNNDSVDDLIIGGGEDLYLLLGGPR